MANYTELYLLRALEPGRAALQVLHEYGPYGCHAKHAAILDYNTIVSRALNSTAAAHGTFGTAVINWNAHQWDLGSKTAVGAAWAEYLAGDGVNFERLPCDILRHNASVVSCPWPPSGPAAFDKETKLLFRK